MKYLLTMAFTLLGAGLFAQQKSIKQAGTVTHVVLLKFKDNTSQQQIDSLFAAAVRLKSVIAGIRSISFGANFSERGQGYTHGEVLTFADRKSLEEFYVHPAHKELIEKYFQPILEGILVFDYEEKQQRK